MFVPAVAAFFKYKLVSSVIVLACWDVFLSLKLCKELTRHGVCCTVACDAAPLSQVDRLHLQGVLVFSEGNNSFLEQIKPKQFAQWYKWLVVGDEVPRDFTRARYDVDVSLLLHNTTQVHNEISQETSTSIAHHNTVIEIQDAYIHPRDGISLHPWAFWTRASGLMVTREYQRINRRHDLNKYPLSIITPVGLYTPESFNNKSFGEYLRDITTPEKDSSIRIGYGMTTLMVETLNAKEVLQDCLLWSTENHNSSMLKIIVNGDGDIAGAVLRLLPSRASRTDIVTYLWPFSVGFLYLADRDSSSNMFVEPFSPGVWWSCLGIGIVLALAQRMTAKSLTEKEGAYMAVLATWLQQDASAAPNGPSGRWTFLVMSLSSMLVHAYYTSSIVSALMSTGTNGPKDLRELAESRYSLTSEDYDWMRLTFFEVDSGWDDMEYLKRRKNILKGSKFYLDPHIGMELVRQGGTAYHAEYNHVYPHLRTFSDDQICKLEKVDTVPEILSWVLTTRQGQWTEVFRVAAAWLHENGLSQRLLSRFQIKPPECRAALLAERVKIGDIVPLIGLTIAGGTFSFFLLWLEIMLAKWKKPKVKKSEINNHIDSEIKE